MSIFISILLLVLKVIGMVLLSILAVLSLCLIILLFVPIRYKAKVDVKDKEILLYAVGSWLFHIVSLSYKLGDTNPFKIKIFGHVIDFNKHKENNKKENKKKRKRKRQENNQKLKDSKVKENTIILDKSNESSKAKEDISIAADLKDDGNLNVQLKELSAKDDKDDKEHILSKKIPESNEDILEELLLEDFNDEDSLDKNDNSKPKKNSNSHESYDKIKDKFNIIKSDSFKQAFSLCKKELKHILKIVLPRKWYINARVGFDDPATTGKILAVSGMLYGLIHKHVSIVGDFENEIIDIHGKFVGHITSFKLLCVAAHLYFNKNLKSIINQFREA